MEKAIAMLDEVKESIINAYEIKTGMSRAKLSHLMDAETWMDADGIVYFRSTANNEYSGDLEIALIPEWFRTEILKEELDKNGVLVEKANISEAEKFALLFEFDGYINAIRHVLYNCSASRPSIESETKEDTIEPGTETLSLTADPREDGLVKSRTGDTTSADTYANWYKAIYVPQAKTEAKPK